MSDQSSAENLEPNNEPKNIVELPTPKAYNPELLERLKKYALDHGLSQAQIAVELGVHSSAVNKYWNGKPAGDVKRLEAVIEDVLKGAAKRRVVEEDLFPTNISETIFMAFSTIRRTNDFGVLTGNAGIGKSCSVTLWIEENPSTIVITAKAVARNARALERLIANQVDINRWDHRTTLFDFLTERLKGSNRLLIVDNGQRVSRGGLDYLFDLHDETKIPMVILGNPDELYAKIRPNDQMFSRIGYKRDLNEIEDPLGLCHKMIEKFAPEFKSCMDMLVKVVNQKGHLRALKKLILLAREILQSEKFKAKYQPEQWPKQALLAAHELLVRDYKLT